MSIQAALQRALSVITVLHVSVLNETTEVIGVWVDDEAGKADAEYIFTELLRAYEPHVSDEDINAALDDGTVSVHQGHATILITHSSGGGDIWPR